MYKNHRIAVVIPCYKVRNNILDVLNKIDNSVSVIYIVDDFCPEKTGSFVDLYYKDKRLNIIQHKTNQGVGGAVISGYKEAIKDKIDIVVKIDGDGQMDPSLITEFINPIIDGYADYTKGNRFYNLDNIMRMPKARIFGNAFLSFFTKLSSGYWNIFDPTNGYTAINIRTIKKIQLEKIDKKFFFESDMLFRLNIINATVLDVPMNPIYNGESSNLRILSIIPNFIYNNFINFFKRIFYNYFLRDFNIASLEFLFGVIFLISGLFIGIKKWIYAMDNNVMTPVGTIILSSLLILTGIQLLLSFINYDVNSAFRKK
jgi:dolichol-phosphate mannosyltransferase